MNTGLEEVITEFSSFRDDVHDSGRLEEISIDNSSGQTEQGERSPQDTTQLSCVTMETVVMDTNQVQSVNNADVNGSDTELSMLSSSVTLSESCCVEDNVNNEKAVVQSPSLAVESRMSSTPPIATSLPYEVGGSSGGGGKENEHSSDHKVLSSSASSSPVHNISSSGKDVSSYEKTHILKYSSASHNQLLEHKEQLTNESRAPPFLEN